MENYTLEHKITLTAYLFQSSRIFLIGAPPHAHQAKKNEYPK
ncbi:hypothetical protein Q5O89_01260 [Peribacillus frigoritolerans]|nr:hypothetical protein [Peribacillus frigoritolerans]